MKKGGKDLKATGRKVRDEAIRVAEILKQNAELNEGDQRQNFKKYSHEKREGRHLWEGDRKGIITEMGVESEQ